MREYYVKGDNVENGFYIESDEEVDQTLLNYLIGNFSEESCKKRGDYRKGYIEIGPLLNFRSPWCSNAVSIFQKCGIDIDRIEKTIVTHDQNYPYDKMTCSEYKDKVKFETEKPLQYNIVPISKINEYNKKMSLSLDESDIKYYTKLFTRYGRYPTDIELYDLAQSNSEHSRHSFFNGKLLIKKSFKVIEEDKTLMNYLKLPLKHFKGGSTLAFCDNASAMNGFKVPILSREFPMKASKIIKREEEQDICFTAETHNFPTSIAPFPGAATGTGGRIRDNQAIGRGGLPIAGTVGYCVGNLCIPNYNLPWEDAPYKIDSLATPLNIMIEASNGASDYGNKFGEPIIQGFVRSFGNTLKNGERIEWLKPIMFTGGLGIVSPKNLNKYKPEFGMVIIRLGGSAYRIGMGGGAASSRDHSESDKEANYNAVQRGDPEMGNKVNRVLRSCIDMGEYNPIISIHDQGAGGTANVTKEIVEPNGAFINIDNILSGDKSLSVLERWVCEYQEQISILIYPDSTKILKKIAKRENCPIVVIGYIDNSEKIQVYDPKDSKFFLPVDLVLNDVLGEIPQKEYILKVNTIPSKSLKLPYDIEIMNVLENVFKLVSVGSKRFLTNKVDRSVTGLIAQQQCVGPLHTPLSNVAVVAQSYYSLKGAATAIGEQPMKGLIDTGVMARMSIGEMLTNIMWAKISCFEDIKCSGNWMWPGKDPIEGYHLYKAVKAVSEMLIKLEIAIDGGKDSMSMKVNSEGEVIKSPKSFVISGYAPCTNILKTITPDLKQDKSYLFFIDLANRECRTSGSALSQVFKQVGNDFPDVENMDLLKQVFNVIQALIYKGLILSGHDRSDGGLITCISEMCIAGNRGCDLYLTNDNPVIDYLFSEELGIIIETKFPSLFSGKNILINESTYYIGRTNNRRNVTITYNRERVVDVHIDKLREMWEKTSFELEKLQCNPKCVEQEIKNIGNEPLYFCNEKILEYLYTFDERKEDHPKIAIIREEGSNGDAEMAAAFEHAGFEVWDVNMMDLNKDKYLLDQFSGLAFVGGFSYSDVFGAAKGWCVAIKYNENIKTQFERFYKREDTFSLGICNGCQLMAELNWIPKCKFVKNDSRRFESRFSTVKINKTNSIMLKGLEDTQLGIWVAHGEGKCEYNLLPESYSVISYIDSSGNMTESYPMNPNGSINGTAGICSLNGRHLAMMPHPERCFLKWQVPYTQFRLNTYYPWFKIFTNAYDWCKQFKTR